ncbi:MAG: peptidylprolyl isomerase [Verrucomicrobiales bacterium]
MFRNPALFGAIATALPSLCFAAAAPTNLRVAAPWNNGTTVELIWEDNSDDEDSFEWELYVDSPTGDPVFVGETDYKGQTIGGLTGGNPNDRIYFRVRAKSAASGDSDWTPFVEFVTPATFSVAIRNGEYASGKVGEAFQMDALAHVPNDSPVVFGAAELPAGLSIDPDTGEITGTPEADGLFYGEVSVSDGMATATTFVRFRILPADAAPVAEAVPAQSLLANAPAQLDLDAYVTDPDTTCAARLVTNRGTIDVILYEKATPASVENFLDYVTIDAYADTVFHRIATLANSGVDVIQAGWFHPDGANYQTVTTQQSVFNEPGIPNDRGTIAIAKLGGAPNSGTSQWYFNMTDSPGLDGAGNNGGFAVFGRASAPTLAIADDIFARPTGTYTVTLDGASRQIPNWPTNQAPAGATPAAGDLVQVLSATKLERFVEFAVTGSTAPAVATGSVDGGTLTVTPADTNAAGEASIQLTATDLDGKATAFTVPVVVRQSLATWVAGHSFLGGLTGAGDDGEGDRVTNLLEYALCGDPSAADAGAILPQQGTATVGEDEFLTLTFAHLKFSSDLIYIVEQSETLAGWTEIWRTADGTGDPLVVNAVDQGAKQILTIRDPNPIAPGASHLRLKVVQAAP